MISIICIIGKNNAIGRNNQLLWDLPTDMKHFREVTKGGVVIMGRKTFESIGRPLPKRTNIIITRDAEYKAEGCTVVNSLESAFAKAKEVPSSSDGKYQNEIFIIGGGEIYRQALPLTDRLYLTIVEDEPEADTFFPDFKEFTKILHEEEHEENGFKFKFIDLER
ncbi:MAG: Dihydrofolate reductase [Candidatus Falkowbacteria bacterium GW2011_GWF2_39_8]|uniref:Dihydrofolate reductase n=1 Tax=Candidatus Falkowbacteria bacterium GW2011_GWF2_39_8 TaxID=1618642 RepID=A0A0G0Q070_9BACT|nr:MAG: Dihydrofolate reductase [Candidatus Falkowbacteria bacterium GW2011_GWF2_39_8]